MKKITWRQITTRSGLGLVIIALGAFVLFSPIFIGEWVIGILGVALIAAGLFQFFQLLRSADETSSWMAYLAGVVTILLGLLLFLSPHMALSAVLICLTLAILIDGGTKIYSSFKLSGSDRRWMLFNGLFSIGLGALIWFFVSANLGLIAIGVVLGMRLLIEGWTMVFMPEKGLTDQDEEPDLRMHPDGKLGLEGSEQIKEMHEALLATEKAETTSNIVVCLSILGVFFVIHVLRTDARWSFIGFISPFSAVIGDAVMALVIGVVVVLPVGLFWRKLTRPLERVLWKRFLSLKESRKDPTIPERGMGYWLKRRMLFAITLKETRYSLNAAFWWLMRIGIPLTAIFIAINSIWGFSWYFNSENWASGVWQEITKGRVDPWRKRGAEEVEKASIAKGVLPEKVFAVETENETQPGDFSFVVIGDTGEGDPSQMILRDQLIAAGKREEVKFLVLASDVIYPDGKMKDYETNFYLAFKGFEKPIYAIPGNHDWFDSNEGFNANFLDSEAAVVTLKSRLLEDLKTNIINTDDRFDEITAEAKRLREYYRIQNGLQRAPYFEIHRAGFSLITVDTGINRTIDEKQRLWLESALQRAGKNFKMVVLGHPFLVAGRDAAKGDKDFSEIRDLLRHFEVDIAMAGDTHDFEFYREPYASPGGPKEMLHFVNGGGGAYLSIGTAVAFPEDPVTPDNAFYPREDELKAKIENEAPYWKLPFLWWMEWLGGYPFDSEMVSGAFDFNRAPFFQSFVQVHVEPSKNQVRIQLIGVNGPLRWRDIQLNGNVKPVDKTDDDPVEFIAPMR